MKFKKSKNGVYDIYFYGIVGYHFDSSSFIEIFNKATEKVKKVNIRVNTVGGDVVEGITIFNLIAAAVSQGIIVNFYIDGIAASMGSVIINAGSNIYISKYAKLMTHRITGGAYGNSDHLKNVAENMIDFEKDLINIYANRTGLTADQCREKFMKNGIDNWLNADKAIAAKLVDGKYDGAITTTPKDLTNEADLRAFVNQSFVNLKTNQKINKMNLLLAKYGLPENTTEQELMNHIAKLDSKSAEEIAALKAELKKAKDKEAEQKANSITNMIEKAIADKKITAEQKDVYTKLANADYEATKNALETMASVKGINAQLGDQGSSNDKYAKYTFKDFQKKAPEELGRIRTEEPERYKTLFENRND